MSISTTRGDGGTTQFGSGRVSKGSLEAEALGALDEFGVQAPESGHRQVHVRMGVAAGRKHAYRSVKVEVLPGKGHQGGARTVRRRLLSYLPAPEFRQLVRADHPCAGMARRYLPRLGFRQPCSLFPRPLALKPALVDAGGIGHKIVYQSRQ